MASLYLTDYLFRKARNHPGKLAVSFDAQQLSWAELAGEVEQTAASLSSLLPPFTAQRPIGLLMPNSIDYLVCYLAIIHLGHMALPIDVIYKELEIDALTRQMAPVLVITDTPNMPRLKGSEVARVSTAELKTGQAKLAGPPLRIGPKRQIASLLFTSGTTGQPKAVGHSHASHLWNVAVCSRVWDWTAADSLLISLRLSHWYGLCMGVSASLYHGNTIHLQDGFKAASTLSALQSGSISIFQHTPYAYAKLLQEPGDYDLSKVRLFTSGSAPLPPKIWQGFKDRFGHSILEAYGSSETGRIAANTLHRRKPGSAGLLLPGVEAKLSKSNELLVRSPGVIAGYYKNLAATRAAKLPGGWWRTGDRAEIKARRIYLHGRTDETIRRNSYSISPRDIEWAMHHCPGMDEIQVLAQVQPEGDQDQLVYFITGSATPAQVESFYKQNLPSIWRPDKVVYLAELPRTPMGKVSLPALRAMIN